MQQVKGTTPQRLHVPAVLDVQAVENALRDLWAGRDRGSAADRILTRARVLNLMIYLDRHEALHEVSQALDVIAPLHPCRAVVMVGLGDEDDRDIEMFISSHCHDAAGAARHVCCEQVTLVACGHYVEELPSAATPLLVSDLPVFLWWRQSSCPSGRVFSRLVRAADRLVIDSAKFDSPVSCITGIEELLKLAREAKVSVSDLNWARLTAWRTLIANFYEVPEYRGVVDSVSRVRVEYTGGGVTADDVPPQAWVFMGWLASRLGWSPVVAGDNSPGTEAAVRYMLADRNGRRIAFEFVEVDRAGIGKGWLTAVEFVGESESPSSGPHSFRLSRSDDGIHFETAVKDSSDAEIASHTFTHFKRSEAEMLERELQILCRDRIFEESVTLAAEVLSCTGKSSATGNANPQ